METIVLVVVAFFCFFAAGAWTRSAYLRHRFLVGLRVQEIEAQREARSPEDSDTEISDDEIVEISSAVNLAQFGFRKDVHAAFLYASLAAASFVLGLTTTTSWASLYIFVIIPAVISTSWALRAKGEIYVTKQRFEVEKRAEETLSQDRLAPRAWADRLAPDELPEFVGLEVGKVYQSGSGLMAGDFFDLFRVSDTRMAAVIGDVSGKDIESSITAFQAKYLLRVFLRQFRDPAQAIEELNRQMSIYAGEDFISLVVLLFDAEAGTMRYASAGHPIVWLWHQREVLPLAATGSLVMINENSTFYSREIRLDTGDVVLLYTDGLSEARKEGELFGEERVADMLRRDPNASLDVMCKQFLEAASVYSDGPINDDVAIMAIRTTSGWLDNPS